MEQREYSLRFFFTQNPRENTKYTPSRYQKIQNQI